MNLRRGPGRESGPAPSETSPRGLRGHGPRTETEKGKARIAGVDLPRDKRGEVALTYIYGVGRPTAKVVLQRANVNADKRVKTWTEDEVGRVRDILERECKVEGDLRREVSMNVKRLMDVGAYRGIRHRKGLPVRGQRTHTNSRTRKGPRRGVMVKKKPTAAAPAAKKAGA